MFRQAVQSVVFWGHRTWQAVSEMRLLVLPDPLSFFVCVRVCVCARAAAPLCSEGCKCNLRHMLLWLMFFRLMSVVISISAVETQECSLEDGLVHTCSKKKKEKNSNTNTCMQNHWVNIAQLPFSMMAWWLFDAVIYFERTLRVSWGRKRWEIWLTSSKTKFYPKTFSWQPLYQQHVITSWNS